MAAHHAIGVLMPSKLIHAVFLCARSYQSAAFARQRGAPERVTKAEARGEASVRGAWASA